jgi:photosystem II stability/assembly factor-like uncharacterized protein
MKYLFHLSAFIIFFSVIANAQWQQTSAPSLNAVNCFAFNGSAILAGTSGDGIFISLDDGINWSVKNNGLSNMFINSIAADTNGYLFAGSNGLNVFSSVDTGNTWIPHNIGGTGTAVSSLAICGDNIFAGELNDGVFKSSNLGNTWTEVGLCCASVLSLCSDANGFIYAGTNASIYSSSGNYTDWSQINNGFPANSVIVLIESDTMLFAGTYGGGIYFSDNEGSSWTALNNGLTDLNVLSLVSHGPQIFAGTESVGVFLSLDYGSNWMTVNDGLSDLSIPSLLICGSFIFAGTSESGIWKRPLSEVNSIDYFPISSDWLNIYLNSASHTVTVIVRDFKNSVLSVYDIQGRLLLQQSFEKSEKQFSIGGFKKGIYLIQVGNNNKTNTEKIVKY